MKMFLIRKKVCCISLKLIIVASSPLLAQNYTTIDGGDGNWTSASNWTNTSGYGNSTPATSDSWGTITVGHTISLTGDYTIGGTLNINSGGYLTVSGTTTNGGGSTININNGGTLYIQGNLTQSGSAINIKSGGMLILDGNLANNQPLTVESGGRLYIKTDALLTSALQIKRGGKVIVDGSVTVKDGNYLIVAESDPSTNSSQYADMIIKQNLISSTSGDVTVNYHGRMAVYGGVSGSTSGGTLFTINNEGQVYVDGDITFTGGGDAIVNNNPGSSANPYGLYVNGHVINSGDDAGTTLNLGNQDDLKKNTAFATFVEEESGGAVILPVTLIDFSISKITNDYIELKWTTASEYNNSHYVILRSIDTKHWEEIGELEGGGTGHIVLHYSFKDKTPIQGLSYYMLKQEDFDGMYETFPAIAAHNNANDDEILVFPNPTTDILNIKSNLNEDMMVSLFSLKSKLIKFESVRSNKLIWDISDLEKATYILKVSTSGGTYKTYKIVKK